MKTINEAAREFALKQFGNEDEFFPERMNSKLSFIAGANFAQQWINIKDELPTEKTKYLIKHEKYGVCIGHYIDLVGELAIKEITHWRHI